MSKWSHVPQGLCLHEKLAGTLVSTACRQRINGSTCMYCATTPVQMRPQFELQCTIPAPVEGPRRHPTAASPSKGTDFVIRPNYPSSHPSLVQHHAAVVSPLRALPLLDAALQVNLSVTAGIRSPTQAGALHLSSGRHALQRTTALHRRLQRGQAARLSQRLEPAAAGSQ